MKIVLKRVKTPWKKAAALLLAALLLVSAAACGNGGEGGGVLRTVTFDLGYGDQTFSARVPDGEKLPRLPAPDRSEEYEFFRWETALKEEYDWEAAVTSDFILYASWDSVWSVKYYLQYGDASPIGVGKAKDGAKTAVPYAPAREGYDFVDWATVSGAVYDFLSPVTDNLSLYATWEISESKSYYTVTFTDPLKLSAPADQSVVSGGCAVRPPAGAYGKYKSVVWEYEENGVKKPFDFGAPVTRDYNLTARWSDEGALSGVQEFPADFFEYILDDDGNGYGVRLKNRKSGYANLREDPNYTNGDYTVPATHDGGGGPKLVTRILARGMVENAYNPELPIRSLYVPGTCAVVEGEAFLAFRPSNAVYLQEGVKEIWACAFQFASGDLYLPSSLERIEPFALDGFREGASAPRGVVTLTDGARYKSVNLGVRDSGGGDIYGIVTRDGKTLVFVHSWNLLRSFTFPSSIERAYPGFFRDCGLLNEVRFEGNLKAVPAGMFAGATRLSAVTYQAGATVEAIEGDETLTGKYRVLDPETDDFAAAAEGVRYSSERARIADCALPVHGAFYNCYFLGMQNSFTPLPEASRFKLPDGLKFVGDMAFHNAMIPKLTVPATVEHIGVGAFEAISGWGETQGPKMASITVAEGNTRYASPNGKELIELGTGEGGGDTFVLYASGNGGAGYTLGSGITSIAPFAFQQARSLTSITLNCGGLKTIPTAAFQLPNVASFTVPAGVEEIREGFPDGMYGNTDMTGSTGANYYPAIDLSAETFYDSAAHNPAMPRTLAFANGSALKAIDDYAIELESSNADIALPNTLREFHRHSIAGGAVSAIKIEAGNDCPYLSGEGNGDGKLIYEEIKEGAAAGKYSLLRVVNADGITDSDGVLQGFYLPAGKTLAEIGEYAFYGVRNIKRAPAGAWAAAGVEVSAIRDYAFEGCSDLTGLTLPAGLETIGAFALAAGDQLTDIEFQGPAPARWATVRLYDSAGFQHVAGVFGETLPAAAAIKVPNGTPDYVSDYAQKLYANGGGSYIAALGRGSLSKSYAVRFDNNGDGVGDPDSLTGRNYLFPDDLPYPAAPAGQRYFQGWYTAAAGGERVNTAVAEDGLYPIDPAPSESGVRLYSRWSASTPYEDGTKPYFGYYLSAFNESVGGAYTAALPKTDARVYAWRQDVFFLFTPAETARYTLNFNDKSFDDSLPAKYREPKSDYLLYCGRLGEDRDWILSGGQLALEFGTEGGYLLTAGRAYFFSVVLNGGYWRDAAKGEWVALDDSSGADGLGHYDKFWIEKV